MGDTKLEEVGHVSIDKKDKAQEPLTTLRVALEEHQVNVGKC